jgi:hypothetical protein
MITDHLGATGHRQESAIVPIRVGTRPHDAVRSVKLAIDFEENDGHPGDSDLVGVHRSIRRLYR